MGVGDYLGVLRRRWLAVVVCLLAGLAGALSLTRSTEKEFQSSARLFVNVPAARGVQEALQGVQLTTGLLRSYAEVATSRAAAQRIIDELELEASPDTVAGQLSASAQDDTLLITVSARDVSPARAQRLADAAAGVFVELVEELEEGREEKTEARVIDSATEPGSPIAPKPSRNLAVGLLLGLGLGLAIAFLLEALDRSIKTPEQAAASVGRPVLAVVPRRRNAGELAVTTSKGDQAEEAYRSLRTSLRFLAVDEPARLILVTSPSAGEGKTSTAANLAVAFAQSGARVVVVDADLRRAGLSAAFGIGRESGLSSVLARQTRLEDALVAWAPAPNLQVLPAGPHPPNPAELVGSEAMAQVLRELGGDDRLADVVLVDAPPVLPVTDAVELATQVDAVVMVVRAGRTRRQLAEEATRRLEVVAAPIIGAVLNAVPRSVIGQYQADYRYSERSRR